MFENVREFRTGEVFCAIQSQKWALNKELKAIVELCREYS
jgi:hypothetical protein